MRHRKLFRVVAGLATLAAPAVWTTASAQQLPTGPSWYRTKDLNADARLGINSSVALGRAMYPTKDPLLGLCKAETDWGTPDPQAASRFAALLNAQRATQRLPPLNLDPALGASAVWKSLHMARYNYLDHNDPAPPEARSAFERGVECGYGKYIAENIAEGQDTADEAMSDWLGSTYHRRNMDNPNYTDMGIGVATARGGDRYWTLDLGRKQ